MKRPTGLLGTSRIHRLRPLVPLIAFFAVFVPSIFVSGELGTLAISANRCGNDWCVTRAFPGGQAWLSEVRPGYRIHEIDGVPGAAIEPAFNWNSAASVTVQTDSGEMITATVSPGPISDAAMRWSLSALAATFAALGSIVWSRRPDIHSAVAFGRFSTVAVIAIAVAPAAGGPAPPWALATQAVSLTLLGPVFFDFVKSLTASYGEGKESLPLVRSGYWAITFALVVGYLASMTFWLPAWGIVRSLYLLSLAVGLVLGIAVLLSGVVRASTQAGRSQLRIPLFGMALGLLPVIVALIGEATPARTLLPLPLAVLFVALIPISFAYTILRNQLWGIRRLIHRGLVYLLLSVIVFAVIALPVLFIDQILFELDGVAEFVVMALALLAGVLLFNPVRSLVRKGVDSLMYGGPVSYPDFIQRLHHDITSADPDSDLPQTLSHVFVERLGLESVLLLREDESGNLEVVAAAGEQSERVLEAVRYGQISSIQDKRQEGLIVLSYEGEQILCVQLWATDTHIGTLLLGPKRGGELFVQDEINLVVNTAPFMATALDRHELSKTMRQLNQRLVETEERSRKNVAIDLHDGPLQKAVTLAIGRVTDPALQKEVATDLVNELREIGSRLRPSILDDFGLPTSLEWLLDHNMRGTDIDGSLTLQGMEEDARVRPDVELALFRITQEAINNAVKHSKASELRITLSQEDEQLTLTIKDNGVGIGGGSTNRIASSRLGLVGMRERAMQVSGHLEVYSRPGEGVFIQATVPFEMTEPAESAQPASEAASG